MTGQEFDQFLNSIDELTKVQEATNRNISEVNKTLQKLDSLNQLEILNKKLSEMEEKRTKIYDKHFSNSTRFSPFGLFILLTVVGIWGLDFRWFVGVSFGLSITGIVSAFYDKVRI